MPSTRHGRSTRSQLAPTPNFAVRIGSMLVSSYVFQPPGLRPLKGRSQKATFNEVVKLFGDPDFIFFCSKGGDPYRRVPLVVERETGHPVISGYAFIGEWIFKKWEKWLKDDSRLAPGMANGIPWK